MQIELILLTISTLFFVSILADKAGYRFGVPTLLLFLVVGMVFGSDGLGITFDDIDAAQTIGTVALCVILFSGGMDTKISEIKPIAIQGIVLATAGVLLTASITGFAIFWVLGKTYASASISMLTAMLMAATMSSTDSASVFSILRSKGLHLKNNLRPMLELESGSNDPMAYVLTITLISIINAGTAPSIWIVIGTIIMQLLIGATMGYILGKVLLWLINKIDINNDSLYPIFVLTSCVFIFSSTYFLQGNSYLAVYIGGLVIGNSKFIHKRTTMRFFNGLSWLSQLIMFLTLGLLVNPHELIPIIIPGCIISLLMVFVTRPISVFACLLPFRKTSLKDKTFVSWVGLRGAVPIIFAILTLAADVPNARLIFNIVFFCTLMSLILQGTSLPLMAKLLGVAEVPKSLNSPKHFDIDLPEEIKSVATEMAITESMLTKGNKLMNFELPDNTLVIMVKRYNGFFVPTGKSIIKAGDRLLLITDHNQELAESQLNQINTDDSQSPDFLRKLKAKLEAIKSKKKTQKQ
ncbi:MAG: potassium/proton antiporter [Bacteroidia bacterium]|nr:potassium/proton antiporter [Bacteroidia bacterium]